MIRLNIVIGFILFFTGALFTSFYELVASRLPKKESISGKSECPHCHHSLRLIDVFPLVGYLFNLGKCHYCKKPIPFQHFIVELIGGGFFLYAYLSYSFTTTFFVFIILYSVLFLSSLFDISHRIVYDFVWLIGTVLLIIIRLIESNIFPYLLSAGVLFGSLLILAMIGKLIFKKDALGGGDIKLYFFIGFVIPLASGFLSIIFASFFGMIYGLLKKDKLNHEIPFVPFIALGVLIAFLFGESLIEWYVSLLGGY